jgi:predicted secreted hydrolase
MRRKAVIHAISPEFMEHEGLTSEILPWEDGLRADTGPGFFEWWYFDAHFDNGTTAVIVFTTKHLLRRMDPLTPTINITISAPDTKKLVAWQTSPVDQFRASKEGCDVRIGTSWVHGDLHRYELHAEAGELVVDLIFTGLVPPWRPGAGKTYFSQDLSRYFAWLPAVPDGSVSGSLRYGGQEYAVSGRGYHDHNWGNVGLNQVMSHWYWGRARLGDFATIFVEQVALPAYGRVKMPVFMLAYQGRILTGDGRPLVLKTAVFQRHAGGRQYPCQLDFDWHSGSGRVHLALRDPQLIEATSLVADLPAWQRWVARLLADPNYFRFQAHLSLSVNLEGVQADLAGPALYELMLLNRS